MLKIRLQRTGKRGQAYFKIVVTEHTTKPQGKYLELLGSYDPHQNKLLVNADKLKHWISQGASLSETANNLLVNRSIIEGDKVQVWKAKKNKKGDQPAQAGEAPAPTQAPVVEAAPKPKEPTLVEEPAPAPLETPVTL